MNIKTTKIQSVVVTHQDAFNHHFDWENAKILNNESNYKKRITSEMIHIKCHLNNINKKEDIFTLSKTYLLTCVNIINLKGIVVALIYIMCVQLSVKN